VVNVVSGPVTSRRGRVGYMPAPTIASVHEADASFNFIATPGPNTGTNINLRLRSHEAIEANGGMNRINFHDYRYSTRHPAVADEIRSYIASGVLDAREDIRLTFAYEGRQFTNDAAGIRAFTDYVMQLQGAAVDAVLQGVEDDMSERYRKSTPEDPFGAASTTFLGEDGILAVAINQNVIEPDEEQAKTEPTGPVKSVAPGGFETYADADGNELDARQFHETGPSVAHLGHEVNKLVGGAPGADGVTIVADYAMEGKQATKQVVREAKADAAREPGGNEGNGKSTAQQVVEREPDRASRLTGRPTTGEKKS